MYVCGFRFLADLFPIVIALHNIMCEDSLLANTHDPSRYHHHSYVAWCVSVSYMMRDALNRHQSNNSF